MATPADHVIQKLTIMPFLSAPRQTSGVTRQLHRLSYEVIPAVVDRVCAARQLPPQEVVLEKIQVDLGTLKWDELSRSFPSKLTQSLEAALEERLTTATFHPVTAITLAPGPRGQEVLKMPGPGREKNTNDLVDLLAYFFKTGALPAHIRKPLSINALIDELLTGRLPAFALLIQQFTSKHKPRKRIAYHLSGKQLSQLITYHVGPVLAALVEALRTDKLHPKSPGVLDHRRTAITEIILLHWFAGDDPSTSPAIRDTLKTLAGQWKQPIGQLIQGLQEVAKDGPGLQRLLNELKQDEQGALAKKEVQGKEEKGGTHLPGKGKRTNKRANKEKKESPVDDLPPGATLVQNAGIILLWPFLEGCFGKLGLTANGRFLPGASKEKAIYLLHHLATASEAAEEYELVVYKLLCGMPIDEPVPPYRSPGPWEREFADGLIQALIKNWPGVGDTDITSIRETYLKRTGWVSKKGNGWLLEIEWQTWDILLDSLPWGLGLVHLPWMEHMIHVEWKRA